MGRGRGLGGFLRKAQHVQHGRVCRGCCQHKFPYEFVWGNMTRGTGKKPENYLLGVGN
jgi:hypothetical protein